MAKGEVWLRIFCRNSLTCPFQWKICHLHSDPGDGQGRGTDEWSIVSGPVTAIRGYGWLRLFAERERRETKTRGRRTKEAADRPLKG